MDLFKNDNGIYYLHDYIPRHRRGNRAEEAIQISEDVLTYKDGNNADMVNRFTAEMLMAIVSIWNEEIMQDEIWLTAVPPSKTYKNSTVRKSIELIAQLYDQGAIEDITGCGVTFVDKGHLIRRVDNINTAHYGRRATYEEQMESLECEEDLSENDVAYIILDDVTTKGTSMEVCKDLLINAGADEEAIYCLAVAQTIW